MKLISSLFVLLFFVTPVYADVADVVSNSYSKNEIVNKKSKTVARRYSRGPLSQVAHEVGHFLSSVLGPRPGAWCGWWMRSQKGGGPEYNLARNWAKRGTSAGGPQVGAVVVWSHHVGIITGKASNGQWIVKSGNDSGAVRERPRSVAGAIAFRIL